MIWVGATDTRAVLVPADPSQDFHIAIMLDGLVRLPGRPAAALGAGIARARARVGRIAREVELDDLEGTFRILV